jgi:glycosyltransferase involved in cell wall biosynthesis
LRWRRLVALAANVVEKSAAMVLDRIVTATPAIARRFPEAKTIALQNFPISGELFLQKGPAYGERPPTVVYVGGITAERGVIEMVRALGLVKPSLGARLVMAGRFSGEALENQARGESGWRCVDYLGHLGREQLAPVLGGARAGLVLFHPGPNHDEAQPNKLFEYMSSGLPLIASHFPLWRSLIDGERCGLLVDPLDPAAIARAIEQILEEPEKGAAMGDRGYAATKTRYNWTVESRKLIDLYHRFDLSAGKATPCAE